MFAPTDTDPAANTKIINKYALRTYAPYFFLQQILSIFEIINTDADSYARLLTLP